MFIFSVLVIILTIFVTWRFIKQEKVNTFYGLIDNQNFTEANEFLENYKYTLRDFKKPYQLFIYQALLAEHYNKNDDALVFLSQALDLENSKKIPMNFLLTIHHLIGRISLKKDNSKLALEHFNFCVQYGDTNPDSYIFLSELYLEQNKEQLAKQVLEIGLKNIKNNDQLHAQLSMVALFENHWEAALEESSHALDINPNNTKANYAYVKSRVMLKDVDTTLLTHIKRIQKDKTWEDKILEIELETFYALGLYKDIVEKASEYFKVIKENNFSLLLYIASACEQIQNYEQALLCYDKIHNFNPNYYGLDEKIKLVSSIKSNNKLERFIHYDSEEFVTACRHIMAYMKYKNIECPSSNKISTSFIGYQIVGSISKYNPKHFYYFDRSFNSLTLQDAISIFQVASSLNSEKTFLYLLSPILDSKITEYLHKNNMMIYKPQEFIHAIEKVVR